MKRGKYKKRTNEEELVIISMRAEGKSVKEIAAALGRTIPSTQRFISKLINECKIEKKGSKCSKINKDELVDLIAKNPGNIQEAFRKYAEKTGLSIHTIHGAYYSKANTNKKRIKDSTTILTVVSKYGHTNNNSKNTKNIARSNIWLKIKDWLCSALLS